MSSAAHGFSSLPDRTAWPIRSGPACPSARARTACPPPCRGEQRQRRLVVLASVAVRVLAPLPHHLLLHALQPVVGDLQALAKMPRLALQLGEVLEHLVGGGLVDMAVVVGDKFDELLHRVELRARHGGAFRQGCRQPPRRFRGDEVEYGGDIMQIRGEALRVEQGLAEATGHHYRGMLAVGGRQVFG